MKCVSVFVIISFRCKKRAVQLNRKGRDKKEAEEISTCLTDVKQLLDSMGINAVIAPGWEADDVLATLAATCSGLGHHCTVFSRDKVCSLATLLTCLPRWRPHAAASGTTAPSSRATRCAPVQPMHS